MYLYPVNSIYDMSHNVPGLEGLLAVCDQRQPPGSTRNQSTSSHYLQSATAASSPSSSPALASRPIPFTAVRSSGVEEMNQMRGYNGPGSGAAGGSSQPNRPMATQPEPPVKLTPITGRVSRAKKGVPVHVCEVCKPPKTFTRAEHLRRHQLSHQTPGHPCQYPGCDRAFHRADLLARHQTRHEQEGDRASTSTGGRGRGDSRPPSVNSTDGGFSTSHASSSMPPSDYTTSYTHNQPSSSGDRGSYPPTSGGSQGQGDQQSYVLGNSGGHMSSGSPFTEFAAPRTPIYIVTEGLPSTSQHPGFDVPPGLQNFDSSPWSGSGISTPSDGNSHYHRSYSPNSDLPMGSSFGYTPVSPGDTFDMSVAPPFGSWLPSPHNHTYTQVIDPSLSFSEESLYDHAPHHQAFTSVRSPTPPNVSSPVHSAESLVTFAPAIPDAQAMVSRHKDLALSGTIYDPAFLTASTLPRPSLNAAIPAFLDIYWKRFDVLFPLVHRQSFEAAPNDVLRCAMAAMATQFLDGREDRAHGYVLHDIAYEEVKRVSTVPQYRANASAPNPKQLSQAPHWNVQIMQAILLCEFFARFRGRKGAVRPSERFQNLYSRDHLFSLFLISPVSQWHPYSTSPLQVASPQVPDSTFASPTPAPTLEGRWGEWVEAEARRRMLAACFVLDVHTAMYHQLPLVHRFNTPCPPIPLTAASKDLWAARSAEDWEAFRTAGWPNNESSVLSDHTVSIETLASAPPLDNAVYLASEALRLPRPNNSTSPDLSTTIDLSITGRISNLFGGSPVANTYLSLHYTPLHDLLAVSGESWLFARKITGPREYLQHQNMLKAWSGSVQSAVATKFAAKALVAFLDNGNDYDDNDNYNHDDTKTASYTSKHSSAKPSHSTRRSYLEWNKNDISDQWALYVNALICWAFGGPYSRATNKTAMTAPATANNPSTPASEKAINVSKEIRKSELAALTWLRTIADLPQAEDVLALRGQRRAALAVVAMVRRRLQAEAAIGERSKLLVDSYTVLSRLEDAASRA
ncbi:zinc finger protein LEE1 [Apiospora phragmitis]|uniref:Zinc finger protein LEE1 n=1 Tax=Apiospora phragmitis TaxID=2905665 RepID=A0ABR1VGN4_9PEZI